MPEQRSQAGATEREWARPARSLPLTPGVTTPRLSWLHGTTPILYHTLRALSAHRGGVFVDWLFRIARNVVNDAWRRGARGGSPRISRDLPIELGVEISDLRAGTQAVAIAHIEIEALRQALGALPDDQRTTMEYRLAGLTTDEIASG